MSLKPMPHFTHQERTVKADAWFTPTKEDVDKLYPQPFGRENESQVKRTVRWWGLQYLVDCNTYPARVDPTSYDTVYDGCGTSDGGVYYDISGSLPAKTVQPPSGDFKVPYDGLGMKVKGGKTQGASDKAV